MTYTVPKGIVASPQEVGSRRDVSSMSLDDVSLLASCVYRCPLPYISHREFQVSSDGRISRAVILLLRKGRPISEKG